MRRNDLSIFVLKNVRKRSVQNAGRAAGKSRRMIAELRTASAGLHADHPDLFVRTKS